MWARFLIAIGLVTGASAANAADVICDKLDDYAKAQWAQKGDPIQRYWVEFHWGIDTDPDTFWSWGYGHSNDVASANLCKWLMDNTNQEFRSELPIRVQRCMGYRFPRYAPTEWQFTDGVVRHQAHDGSWLVLEVSSQGMRSGESAVRISFDSVDRNLDPEELPPIRSMDPVR
ncbi:MAG TPA: hypothetical protein VF418_15555 [Sphingomonadaceae bacterium]